MSAARMPEQAERFFKRLEVELFPTLHRATIPLYGIQDSKIVRDRTGVLLRVADRYFIVTASHDLKAIVEHKIPLYAGWSAQDECPCPIVDSEFHFSDEESLDIAFIALTPATVERIVSTSEPVSLRVMSRPSVDDDALYLLVGYPQEWLSVMPDRVESHPLNYACRRYVGATPPLMSFQYNPEWHKLLAFDRDVVHVRTREDLQLPTVQGLKGISGCGIWRVVDSSLTAMDEWSADQVTLEGIEHRIWQNASKAVALTRIQCIRGFFATCFPELVPAMKLQY